MKGSLFSFAREIQNDSGRRYSQTLSVFARDTEEAELIRDSTLMALRAATSGQQGSQDSDEDAAYSESPEWRMSELPLDDSRFLGMDLTSWVE